MPLHPPYTDAVRELEKAREVLTAARRYFIAHNESMAALHMSDKVMASPLTAAIEQAIWGCDKAVNGLRDSEES